MLKDCLIKAGLFSLLWLLLPAVPYAPGRTQQADLHLKADNIATYADDNGQNTLVLQGNCSVWIAGQNYTAKAAAVWLRPRTRYTGTSDNIVYDVRVYLESPGLPEQNPHTSPATVIQQPIPETDGLFLDFTTDGTVYITTDNRRPLSGQDHPVLRRAAQLEKNTENNPDSPQIPFQAQADNPSDEENQPRGAQNPINIAPAGTVVPEIEVTRIDEQTRAATIIGRFFLWHQLDSPGRFLELQADTAVVYFTQGQLDVGREQTQSADILAQGRVSAIYLAGDVILAEGNREITASQMYYDFTTHDALAVKAQMRTFDTERQMPIYVRAARLRQIARRTFEATDVTLTPSEFHSPQIAATVGRIRVVDETDLRPGQDAGYDAQLSDFRLKLYDRTIFYWPGLRSNLERPELPIKSLHAGHDSTFGATLETRWYLSRLLGLEEPQGTDAELLVDYYSKRGLGAGVNVDYERENYFGDFIAYIINDTGQDRLGRADDRRNLDPPRDLRGRISLRHRHFLPWDWQLTAGLSYLSDRNFLEQYHRREFNVGYPQETYLHATRKQENWGLSLLASYRLNNFQTQLEELPGLQYHLTGQSLLDDRLTLYSTTQASRFRQRFADFIDIDADQSDFSFFWHRTEIDVPLRVANFNIVPLAAGNFAYEDRAGFAGPINQTDDGSDAVFLGELGVRAAADAYWNTYPQVQSQLWDLENLRHVVQPELKAVSYYASDDVIEQRDILSVGISQRLQTRRGPADQRRTVDWMRLDLSTTFVSDQADEPSAPDRITWNRPFVPFRIQAVPTVFNDDMSPAMRRQERFGPNRHYFAADYIWQLSDTTAVVSDGYYDMDGGTVQQYNVGISRMRWPDLSYYIGSRYLRDVQVADQRGSHALTFAANYRIDPRYSVVFSQQFDFKYGSSIRSDLSLVRRYHRLFYAVTFSADQSLDRSSIVFSIWPQGVSELALGQQGYMGLGTDMPY